MPSRMSNRVDGVEVRLDRVEHGMEEIRQEVKQDIEAMKQTLLAEMDRLIWRVAEGDRGRGRAEGNGERLESLSVSNAGGVRDDKLDEFRLSAKKVELPAFEGDDLVDRITRAETYFEVQRISKGVRIQLAKLSMEGATIHWFNIWKEFHE